MHESTSSPHGTPENIWLSDGTAVLRSTRLAEAAAASVGRRIANFGVRHGTQSSVLLDDSVRRFTRIGGAFQTLLLVDDFEPSPAALAALHRLVDIPGITLWVSTRVGLPLHLTDIFETRDAGSPVHPDELPLGPDQERFGGQPIDLDVLFARPSFRALDHAGVEWAGHAVMRLPADPTSESPGRAMDALCECGWSARCNDLDAAQIASDEHLREIRSPV